jgi:hypothetical protein
VDTKNVKSLGNRLGDAIGKALLAIFMALVAAFFGLLAASAMLAAWKLFDWVLSW